MAGPTKIWVVSAAELEGVLSSLQSEGGVTASQIRLMREPEVAAQVGALLGTIEQQRQG